MMSHRDKNQKNQLSIVTFVDLPDGHDTARSSRISIPKRMTFQVMLDNIDVTPKMLIPPLLRIDDSLFGTMRSRTSIHHNVFQSKLHIETAKAESTFLSHYGTFNAPSLGDILEGPVAPYESFDDIINPYVEESLNLSPIIVDESLPAEININLTETSVIFLFEIRSIIVEDGTEEAELVKKDNEIYEYLTKGKGRNRKVLNAETQTQDLILKSRSTTMKKVYKKHNDAFASGWDMLDSMAQLKKSSDAIMDSNEDITDPKIAERTLKTNLVDLSVLEDEDKDMQMKNLVRLENFQIATMVMERILDGNIFDQQQCRIRGLNPPDPFVKDVEFKYQFDLLWYFCNEHVYDRPVVRLCLNSKDEDIIAVAYGKFYFTEKKHGMVCIWNIKNPSQPERQYKFPVAVTCVQFSERQPNLLAVSFYDGTLKVLNVANTKTPVVSELTTFHSLTHFPIWDLVWMQSQHQRQGAYMIDYVLGVSEDGLVSYYSQVKSRDLNQVPLLNVTRMEGKIKGINTIQECLSPSIPISNKAAVLCVTLVPYDKTFYLVGTDEGTVHRCSAYFLNQHLDVFLAHNGPVYSIQYSPFCNRIFLTCGADWSVRIWSENIYEPLITLSHVPLSAVQMAVWSPQTSTIIASISGTNTFIWDISKRSYLPARVEPHPTKARITSLTFVSTGRNLLIGDIEGKVYIYSLEKMPFPPFYQENILLNAIKKKLDVRPDLLKKLRKATQQFERLLTITEKE